MIPKWSQKACNCQGCDCILHGGDISSQEILDQLEQIAPVKVVRGNNDKEWAEHLPLFQDFELGGLRVYMTHKKKDLPKDVRNRQRIGSGILCLSCYLLASLSSSPVLGLIGCVFCGFSVGIMWPGTISITSPRLPQGGTALFALLAMAGDLGGAFGPSLVGTVTQQAGDRLQAGMLAGSVFPLVLIVSLVLLKRQSFGKTHGI